MHTIGSDYGGSSAWKQGVLNLGSGLHWNSSGPRDDLLFRQEKRAIFCPGWGKAQIHPRFVV